MDETDRKLLNYLKENARTSATDLSKKVNLLTFFVLQEIKKTSAPVPEGTSN